MSKTIVVQTAKCIGCQTCVLIDPQVFKFNQKTFKAEVQSQTENKNTQTAINSCPTSAIIIKK
ncbi:ferredoxin [Patescibacteria group bacterium]|nr:ferredoxin [Patescibacteria group bacterium]